MSIACLDAMLDSESCLRLSFLLLVIVLALIPFAEVMNDDDLDVSSSNHEKPYLPKACWNGNYHTGVTLTLTSMKS